MKKLCLLLAPILLFLSCGKDDGPAIDLMWVPIDFTIPAGTNPFETYHFYKKNLPTGYFNALAAKGIDPATVTGVRAASGVFNAEFADAQYKWLQEVSIIVYHEDSPTVDLEAFYQDVISVNSGNQLILNPSLADLSDFLKSDKISLDIAITPRGTTPESIPTHMNLAFRIKL